MEVSVFISVIQQEKGTVTGSCIKIPLQVVGNGKTLNN
jgi:hypothetical protein